MNLKLVGAMLLVLSSSGWLTAHVALCWGLWSRLPERRRLWLALLPPTAWLVVPWGLAQRLRFRVVIWLLCAATYFGCYVALSV